MINGQVEIDNLPQKTEASISPWQDLTYVPASVRKRRLKIGFAAYLAGVKSHYLQPTGDGNVRLVVA